MDRDFHMRGNKSLAPLAAPEASPRQSFADCVPSRPCLKHRGFTLIEVLVVIILIAIIGSVVAPNVFRHVASAKVTTTEAQLRALEAALDAYRLDVGRYPTTDEGLSALEQRSAGSAAVANWRGPYLRQAVPADPWGARYQYRSPSAEGGIGYDLFSFGADGQPGGEGEDSDISIRPIRP